MREESWAIAPGNLSSDLLKWCPSLSKVILGAQDFFSLSSHVHIHEF